LDRKIKIGYLLQEGGPDVRKQPFTGPANHVRHVFNNLNLLGHEIRLIARYDGVIWRSDDLKEFSSIDTPELEVGARRKLESLVRGIQAQLKLPYLNYFDSLRFSHACQSHLTGFNLFYERLGWMSLAGGMAAKKMGIPRILEVNNGDFLRELRLLGNLPVGLQLKISVRLMKWSMQQANLLIASGDGHKEKLIELWGIDPDQVVVVENGSELVEMLSRENLQAFATNKSRRDVRLVYAGAFDPWQGVDVLLRAMRCLVNEGYAIGLTLIGDGIELANIEQLIDELDLRSHVRLTGSLEMEKLAVILAESDIGLAPYCGWPEYSGLKLFDYKSAGLAIIVSGEDSRPKTIEHNRTGLIVRPCDVADLTDALRRLAKDSDLRCSLGQSARLEAEHEHSWSHTVKKIERQFIQVLAC